MAPTGEAAQTARITTSRYTSTVVPVTLPTMRGKLFVIVREKTVGAKRVQALL